MAVWRAADAFSSAQCAPRVVPDRREWHARLSLRFERAGARTILARQEHEGPLLVQKVLYPEGPCRAQAIVLHPPGGIAAGDHLCVDVTARADAHALITAPGATKWYRSGGSDAASSACLVVGPHGALEWLPREAIVFDGARLQARLAIDVAAQGCAIGWEIWCLGRIASGERWRQGRIALETKLRVAGRLRWEERGVLTSDSALLGDAAGYAGYPVHGTLWAAGPEASRALLDACRGVKLEGDGRGAVTQLPQLLLARYLGKSTEAAFQWFATIWALLRPEYLGCEAVRPRIWNV